MKRRPSAGTRSPFASYHGKRRTAAIRQQGVGIVFGVLALSAVVWGVASNPPSAEATPERAAITSSVAGSPSASLSTPSPSATQSSVQSAGRSPIQSPSGQSAQQSAAQQSAGRQQAAQSPSPRQPSAAQSPVQSPSTLPAPAGHPATQQSTPPPVPGPYSISVTATGYQKEIDECQWVRMDIGAAAPIVGAHTQCDGGIVLQMQPGQRVDLRGQGLDGDYVVTGSRNAHAGEDAALATQGMVAAVILQTCYPTGDGSERLVTLVPAG